MNTTQFDVAVIGAGIVGASCAYHLAQRGLKVVVLEAFASHAEGSTGLSFASIRGQWADDLNTELSWRSIRTYRDFERDHGVDVGYAPNGYLMLIPQHAWDRQLESVELQRRHGVPVEVLTRAGSSHHPFRRRRNRWRDLGQRRRPDRPARNDGRLPHSQPRARSQDALQLPRRRHRSWLRLLGDFIEQTSSA
jgi:glycine/D-amino acid oxidase-like deaminating enzyme